MAAMTAQITALVDPSASATSRRLAWLAAAPDGHPLGSAFLWIPTAGGVADLELHVHPAERQARIGTQLLHAAIEAAAAAEPALLGILTQPVEEDSPGDHFCAAAGLRRVLRLTYTRLALDSAPSTPDSTRLAPGPVHHALDPVHHATDSAHHTPDSPHSPHSPGNDAPAVARAVPGYRLVHWEGRVPDELAETFARARRAMDDMPMDDATYIPPVWDVDRLHAAADAVARRDEILLVTAALITGGDRATHGEAAADGEPATRGEMATGGEVAASGEMARGDEVAAGGEVVPGGETAADGAMVAFTELVVRADGTGDGQHYGTGVLPEHRGHGLARWMKAEQIARTRVRFPRLAGLLADTADSNTAMRRINESLGYQPTHRSLLYQHDLKPVA